MNYSSLQYAIWRIDELKTEIHPGHRDQNIDAYKCPLCERKGQWRRGVGFEHEKICLSKNHEQAVSWDPERVLEYRQCLNFIESTQSASQVFTEESNE